MLHRTARRRWLLVLVAAALGSLLALPVASAGLGPAEPTQRVLVRDGDGELAEVEVTSQGLAELRADPTAGPVVAREGRAKLALAESVPKVGAPAAWADGQRGAGKVIVVIDTGVATSFGGTLAGQACFAANGTGATGYCGPVSNVPSAFDATCFNLGVCGAADTYDAAAARPCSGSGQACQHGTAVAAVAARHNAPLGVAPDAGVYAIRVFDPPGTSAYLYDILLALDHVRKLSEAGLDITSVNLSLSAGLYAGACDVGPGASDEALAFAAAFDNLRARGIASVVASGNDRSHTRIGLPACVSGAVSVGASDLDDDLADFGNRGPGLDLVAPGADEGNGTVDPMDIPGSPYTAWSGTSFSAPHVAGAFALLRPQYPKASVHQLVSFLRSTGVGIAEPEGSYRRMRLLPTADALKAGVLFPTDLDVAGAPVPATGDFDGDGRADVLAHAPGSAPDRISWGTGGWTLESTSFAVSGTYQPLVGNFRGTDGADDILWYAAGRTGDYLWTGSASRSFASSALAINGSYAPVVGDFDGNGFDDILWYAAGGASDYLWYGGATGFSSAPVAVNGTYRTAVGDFNGDLRDDVVFHAPGTATDSLWRGTTTAGTWNKSTLTMSGSYTQRVGDVNGDGRDDLVLYQPGSGADTIWRGAAGVGSSGGTGGFSPLAISVNGTYQPAIGDLDGDARADIIWYAPGGASDYVWFGRATGAPSSRAISVYGTYTPLVADVDADAGDDIVWFNASAAVTPVWWSYDGTP